MKKRNKAAGLLWLPLLIAVLTLAGCGSSGDGRGESDAGQDTGSSVNLLEIKKDGKLSNTTEEAFEAGEYGEEDALKDYVLRNAAECNEQLGEEQITVKKLEVKKGTVTLVMEYESGEAFGAFHDYPFFYGTVAQAYEEGYDLDVELYEAGADGGGASIGREQLLEMGSRNIVIAQLPPREHLSVQTSGKILYISGAEYVKSNVARLDGPEEGSSRETAYIVFK